MQRGISSTLWMPFTLALLARQKFWSYVAGSTCQLLGARHHFTIRLCTLSVLFNLDDTGLAAAFSRSFNCASTSSDMALLLNPWFPCDDAPDTSFSNVVPKLGNASRRRTLMLGAQAMTIATWFSTRPQIMTTQGCTILAYISYTSRNISYVLSA
jgi:hypothetical protein